MPPNSDILNAIPSWITTFASLGMLFVGWRQWLTYEAIRKQTLTSIYASVCESLEFAQKELYKFELGNYSSPDLIVQELRLARSKARLYLSEEITKYAESFYDKYQKIMSLNVAFISPAVSEPGKQEIRLKIEELLQDIWDEKPHIKIRPYIVQ